MSNKIIQAFVGPLTANGLKIWLGQCEDGFENYQDTHKDFKFSVKTRIRLTGSSLQEPQMAEWWSAGRTEYLELTTWDVFVTKIKDRWLPVDWKTDALERFYGCFQGKRNFRTFAGELSQCLGQLPSGTISSTIYKYHLLFHSHPQLYLRMRALQSFSIESTSQTPDQLISLMAAQWDSLVADTTSRRSLPPAQNVATAAPIPLRLGSVTTTGSAAQTLVPPPLTDEDKAALANGCWNCRKKPGEADWVPHTRHTCPGNPAIGARPGRDYVAPASGEGVTKTIAAAAFSSWPRDDDTDEDDVPYSDSDDSD